MMAKIVKGQEFKGEVNYILDKNKGTEILDSDGLRLKSHETIIQSFRSQTETNHRLKKPVGHISLDFSSQDKEKRTNKRMVEIAREYMNQRELKIQSTWLVVITTSSTRIFTWSLTGLITTGKQSRTRTIISGVKK